MAFFRSPVRTAFKRSALNPFSRCSPGIYTSYLAPEFQHHLIAHIKRVQSKQRKMLTARKFTKGKNKMPTNFG